MYDQKKKEGRFWGEAGTGWKQQGESVETAEQVLVGGLLWLGDNSVPVWKSVGDGLTEKQELGE